MGCVISEQSNIYNTDITDSNGNHINYNKSEVKTLKNANNDKHFYYQCLILSNKSYDKDISSYENWKQVTDITIDSNYCKVFKNSKQQYVVVFRGSDNAHNWTVDDVKIAIGQQVNMNNIQLFWNDIVKVEGILNADEIIFAGHSLGGFLVQVMVVETLKEFQILRGKGNREKLPRVRGITFDAPGAPSKKQSEEYFGKDCPFFNQARDLIINYVNDPDLVNVCGWHLGCCKKMKWHDNEQTFNVQQEKDKQFFGKLLINSINQHIIEDIIKQQNHLNAEQLQDNMQNYEIITVDITPCDGHDWLKSGLKMFLPGYGLYVVSQKFVTITSKLFQPQHLEQHHEKDEDENYIEFDPI